MVSLIVPTVDPGNPMYCPEVTASVYLRRLRQISSSSRHSGSFAHSLSLSSYDTQVSSCDPSCIEDTFLFPRRKVSDPSILASNEIPRPPSAKRKVDDVSHKDGHSQLKRRKLSHLEPSSSASTSGVTHSQFPILFDAVLPQDSSESIFQDLNNDIFLEKIQPSPRRMAKLERDLYGPPIGEETPRSLSRLLAALNRELPGIFLSNRLSALDCLSHQGIIDLLSTDGYLGRHILEYFRGSFIDRLDLSASLSAADGLNSLRPSLVLDSNFTRLTALYLNNVCLDDFDLTRIHHLPSLTTIWLNNTTIGNEAIGHLTSLKNQVKELQIEDNPRITDDCIPSLCLFRSLILLRLYGTRIGMPGLRRLALSIRSAAREIDVEIPQACEKYLNNLHVQYQLHPMAPLITDPSVCASLSVNALKANLAGHAIFNPSIYLSGSRPELADRLRDILEKREADRLVKEVVWGYASSTENSVEGNEEGVTESDSSV